MQKYLKEQSHSTRRIKLGILTFYKKQKQLIEKKLKELSLPTDTCQVMTVDSSQGIQCCNTVAVNSIFSIMIYIQMQLPFNRNRV